MKPAEIWTRAETEAAAGLVRSVLWGIGDTSQEHIDFAGVTYQHRRPMTAEEEAGLTPARNKRLTLCRK